MAKVKVSTLAGAGLDWAVHVALARTQPFSWLPGNRWYYSPSTHWAHGGPIIEQEGIGMFCNRTAREGARFKPDAGADWRAFPYNKHGEHYYGPTPLIAAMRCFVMSTIGDTVDVPEELLNGCACCGAPRRNASSGVDGTIA